MSSKTFLLSSPCVTSPLGPLMRNSCLKTFQGTATWWPSSPRPGVIRRDVYGRPDPNRYAPVACIHDASEILTGDLPTPIKYHNAEIMDAYHQVEDLASENF